VARSRSGREAARLAVRGGERRGGKKRGHGVGSFEVKAGEAGAR
jgi:hypothetical protein